MNDYYKSINWQHRTKSVQGISYKWLIKILLSACILLFPFISMQSPNQVYKFGLFISLYAMLHRAQ